MKKKISCLIAIVLCSWICPIFAAGALSDFILSVRTSDEYVNVYVKDCQDSYGEVTAQIGTTLAKKVEVLSAQRNEISIKTIILLDNSDSCAKENSAAINTILDNVISLAGSSEQFKIGTFADQISWATDDYLSDKTALKSVIKNIPYINQETYLSDCLYSLISELGNSNEEDFIRVIVITDGADNKSIGYTNSEMLSLLEKTNIPVYTVGTPGNSDSLENLFSFSRSSNASYYLLGDEVSNEEIAVALTAATNITCFRIYPDEISLDGSRKSIRLTLDGAVLSCEAEMPFLNQMDDAEKEEIVEIQDSENFSSEAEQNIDPVGDLESRTEEAEESQTITANPLERDGINIIYIIIAIAVAVIVLVVTVIILVRLKLTNKKKPVKLNTDKKEDENISTDKTMALYEEESTKTESLFDTKTDNFSLFNTDYELILEDIEKPENEFKYNFSNKAIISRNKQGDILIPYDSAISNPHCEISKQGSDFYVQDLKSLNGTKLNGKKLSDVPAVIKENDEIVIGRTKCKVKKLR